MIPPGPNYQKDNNEGNTNHNRNPSSLGGLVLDPVLEVVQFDVRLNAEGPGRTALVVLAPDS